MWDILQLAGYNFFLYWKKQQNKLISLVSEGGGDKLAHTGEQSIHEGINSHQHFLSAGSSYNQTLELCSDSWKDTAEKSTIISQK